MNQQLTIALKQANEIIASQLNLESCPTEGLPNLQREKCLQCDQIGPCLWRYHSSSQNQGLQDTKEITLDLTFAFKLISQAVARLTLSPAKHQQALTWLKTNTPLLLRPKKPLT